MKQTQRVHFIWILLLVLLSTVFYYFTSQKTGVPDKSVFVLLGLAGFLYYVVYLNIQIDSKGICLQFTPFVKRTYPWHDIQEVLIMRYHPILDFGGWGLRYSFTKKAWCYSVHGSDAIRLTLKNGKKIYIGVDNPASVSQYIADLKKNP
jgi:hypothetical protein